MNKTINSWYNECLAIGKLTQDKYANAWNDSNCSDKTRTYYSIIAINYYNLSVLLSHIIKTSEPINRLTCYSCKLEDKDHAALMHSLYNKYKWFIKNLGV